MAGIVRFYCGTNCPAKEHLYESSSDVAQNEGWIDSLNKFLVISQEFILLLWQSFESPVRLNMTIQLTTFPLFLSAVIIGGGCYCCHTLINLAYIFSVHMACHVSMTLSDTGQVQWHKKAVISVKLVALLQLCKSLTMDSRNVWPVNNLSNGRSGAVGQAMIACCLCLSRTWQGLNFTWFQNELCSSGKTLKLYWVCWALEGETGQEDKDWLGRRVFAEYNYSKTITE